MVSVLTQTEKIDWGERRSNIRSWTEDNIPNLKFQSEPPGQKVTEKKNSEKKLLHRVGLKTKKIEINLSE